MRSLKRALSGKSKRPVMRRGRHRVTGQGRQQSPEEAELPREAGGPKTRALSDMVG